MSTYILPPGFIHVSQTIVNSGSARPMIITAAAQIAVPPWTQANTNQLRSLWGSALAPLYDAGYAFPEMVVIAGGDPPTRFVSSASTTGSRAAFIQLPQNVSFLVRKDTGFVGRRYRGRLYLPPTRNDVVNDNGTLTSSELALLTTAANALFNALDDTAAGNNTAGAVLLHSELPSTPTPVLQFVPENVIATQRRRVVRNL